MNEHKMNLYQIPMSLFKNQLLVWTFLNSTNFQQFQNKMLCKIAVTLRLYITYAFDKIQQRCYVLEGKREVMNALK